ncbi:WXG100 family type VII secretion target [Actinokineospora sp. NBRC 105648]|uniref:WXG100 family type VII secretion target n=1 Tax=Actinokineospora sp. NBRC 105648 TaxID=3032206 RepID=UPI0024A50D6E|nr:WXG100 family type VII secretion target [Actinokineospora sp. NBRC 105648]GLZ39926.1 hypothetical protein Acsp05_35500 [Actinokineospora sp. NBRC 105648]
MRTRRDEHADLLGGADAIGGDDIGTALTGAPLGGSEPRPEPDGDAMRFDDMDHEPVPRGEVDRSEVARGEPARDEVARPEPVPADRYEADPIRFDDMDQDESPDPARPAQPEVEATTLPALDPKGGLDGPELQANIAGYLDFLSALCRQLGMPDPVEEYFAPVVGRWSELHAEAERWRAVGGKAEHVANELTKPLGGLDAAWKGADADSFIEYMTRVGLAGNDMSDAMAAMGEILDLTADGLREIVTDMAGLLAEVADNGSRAMSLPARNDDRTRQYLDSMRRPTRELFEAVRQILEALVRLCESMDGSRVFESVAMAHTFPEENWALKTDVPTVTVPSDTSSIPAAAGADPLAGLKSGGLGGGGLGGGIGGGGAGMGSAASATPPQPGGYVAVGEAAPGKPAGLPVATPAAEGGKAGGAGGMMGGMPMGMGGMGQGGAGGEHKRRVQVTGDPKDIFGDPTKSSPPVIGND